MQWTEEEEDFARGKMDGWASYQSGALVGSRTVDVGPTAELAVTARLISSWCKIDRSGHGAGAVCFSEFCGVQLNL